MPQKKLIYTLLLLFVVNVWAHQPERGKVMGTVGPAIFQTLTNSAYGKKSPVVGGLGIIAEGDVDHNGGIEIGMFYQEKYFFSKASNQSLVEKIKLIAIVMGYRHWFSPEFSAGVGFSSSYTIGEASLVHKNFTDSPLTTSARDVTEYGFDFSLQWEPWSEGSKAIVIDARYSQSITAKVNEDANQYMVLFGYKQSIQVK